MRTRTLAGLLIAIATVATPLAASADTRLAPQHRSGNPLDAYAMDASAYGGQSVTIAQRMRSRSGGHRWRMHRHRMYRHR